MNCQPPDERLLKDLIRRVKALEASFGAYKQIMGVDTTPEQSIVAVTSITQIPVGSQVQFELVWPSAPGEFFQIETSPDATSWTSVASPIPAAEAPETSTRWTSIPVSIGDTPIYWRIRRFPVAFAPCSG